MIENGADVNARGKGLSTPLHASAYYGNFPLISYMKCFQNFIIIFKFCGADHANIAQLLIVNGADIDAKDQYDDSPLHMAATEGK